ncbi:MAG: hypothetical protein ACRDLB_13305 [Actinomycetota bacterium]
MTATMFAALLLAGCNGEPADRASDGPAAEVVSDGPAQGENGGASSTKNDDGRTERERVGRGEKGSTRKDASGSSSAATAEGADRGRHAARDDRSGERLTVPAAGSYSYAQRGWEELCRGASCDRSDLPPSQTVDISFIERSRTRAVFVSETEGSGSRTQSVTYSVTPSRATITRLESTFSSGAFRFTTVIAPDPPVIAAQIPLEVGERWTGRWRDRNGSVDGSYSFKVVGTDRVTIGGSEDEAAVLDTSMELRGDFRGRYDVRLWVIPESFMIVASKGSTDIESQYGTYRSRFTTELDPS